ncbi:MAG TPA: hypothetical protein VM076_05885 [Gemmatimonadaceae bacterium]|nr:hypothetical protein [Gemmatimonadaceae bacterium]
MESGERWWKHPLSMGVGSLAVALSVTFGPLAIDEIRARRSARPIAIVASPFDTLPLSYRATSELTRTPLESLAVTVEITNTGGVSVPATVSENCPVLFQVRDAGDTVSRTRWSGPVRACPIVSRAITLGPSQVERLRAAAAVRDILGDSLPDGRYLVSAFMTLNGATGAYRAGEVTLRRSVR